MNKQKQWANYRRKLKKIYEEKGITTCEIKLGGCWKNNALSFAHRHKRKFYLDKPELIGDFNQTILACIYCHQFIEDNKILTEQIFNKLRPQK